MSDYAPSDDDRFKMNKYAPQHVNEYNLTERNEAFCHQYLSDETYKNGTNSYLKIYPDSSREAAGVSAHDLLKQPKVIARIGEIEKDLIATRQLSQERVIREFMYIAFGDIRRAYTGNGETSEGVSKLRDISEMPEEVARMVSSIEHNKDGSVKLRTYDKQKALTQLGEYMGMWKNELTLKGDADNPIKLVAAAIDAMTPAERDKALQEELEG